MDLPIELAAFGLSPLEGGYSGETFVSGEGSDRVVVRIYGSRSAARGESAVEVDAAVLRLMRGIVPVPEVLEVRRPAADHPGLLVTSFLPGERADLLLGRAGPADRERAGRAIGRVLDRLAHIPTLRPGTFVDGDLLIRPFPPTADGLPGWVDAHLERLSGWTEVELMGLARVAEDAQALLDTVGRTCFVHSDLNPKNLLLDPESLEVVGVLDWEFAHSGSPYTDLGNLVRFERDEAFTAGVLAGVGLAGAEGARALDLARAADLWALVDLAARDAEDGNPVTGAATALLRAVARSGDLHAVAG
ncbi:MAG TPA: phosphotransferase [Nocardioides sp.]